MDKTYSPFFKFKFIIEKNGRVGAFEIINEEEYDILIFVEIKLFSAENSFVRTKILTPLIKMLKS